MIPSGKVLFIAEGVTLAHVGRMLTLSAALHQRGFAVELALGAVTGKWPTPYPQHHIAGIGADSFAAALRTGAPVLNRGTLRRLVEADLQVIDAVGPELVIGDFRLSLSISARLLKVPYATLTNAYWSAAYEGGFPMPVLPLSRTLPIALAQWIFDVGKSLVLPMHCAPMNSVRRDFGLPSLGDDLRKVYTDADHALFADIPTMFPVDATPREHFLGPVWWSPDVGLPDWWGQIDLSRPIVYVTMGSSGDSRVLAKIVEVLAGLPVTGIVSGAGSELAFGTRANIHVARYLPGERAAQLASMVICNGGSMGCQQAFAAGVPVLGVAGNMDQFLNMAAVVQHGAGLLIRADRVSSAAVRTAVERLLRDSSFSRQARRLGEQLRACDAGQRLCELLPLLRGG